MVENQKNQVEKQPIVEYYERLFLGLVVKSEEGFLLYGASIFKSVLVYTAERGNS